MSETLKASGKVFPISYLENNRHEREILKLAENFCRQFKYLYPDRIKPQLHLENECEIRKLVCSTLCPLKVTMPTELRKWRSSANFCADFFYYDVLFSPLECPKILPSVEAILKKRRGNSLELSTTLCTLLLASDYDAYVVQGYARKSICEKLKNSDMRPPIEFDTDSEIHKRYFTDAKPREQISSEYNKYELDFDAYRSFWFEGKSTFHPEEEIIEDPTVEEFEDDVYLGKRIHFWILMSTYENGCMEIFFVEPTTGERKTIEDLDYLGIEFVWNDKNFWCNNQKSSGTCKDIAFDLDDCTLWEAFLPEYSIEEESENPLRMPSTWVRDVEITREDQRNPLPKNGKTVQYKMATIIKYNPGASEDGLVHHVKYYKTREKQDLLESHEFFSNRKDFLECRRTDFTNQLVVDVFSSGRADSLKEHEYPLKGILKLPRKLQFYSHLRKDKLSLRTCTDEIAADEFVDRSDYLVTRKAYFFQEGVQSDIQVVPSDAELLEESKENVEGESIKVRESESQNRCTEEKESVEDESIQIQKSESETRSTDVEENEKGKETSSFQVSEEELESAEIKSFEVELDEDRVLDGEPAGIGPSSFEPENTIFEEIDFNTWKFEYFLDSIDPAERYATSESESEDEYVTKLTEESDDSSQEDLEAESGHERDNEQKSGHDSGEKISFQDGKIEEEENGEDAASIPKIEYFRQEIIEGENLEGSKSADKVLESKMIENEGLECDVMDLTKQTEDNPDEENLKENVIGEKKSDEKEAEELNSKGEIISKEKIQDGTIYEDEKKLLDEEDKKLLAEEEMAIEAEIPIEEKLEEEKSEKEYADEDKVKEVTIGEELHDRDIVKGKSIEKVITESNSEKDMINEEKLDEEIIDNRRAESAVKGRSEVDHDTEMNLEKDRVNEKKSREKVSEEENEEPLIKKRSELDSDKEMNSEKDMISEEKITEGIIDDQNEKSTIEEDPEANRETESDLEKNKVDEEKSMEKITEDENEESSFKEGSEVDSDMEMNLEKGRVNEEKSREKVTEEENEEPSIKERSELDSDTEINSEKDTISEAKITEGIIDDQNQESTIEEDSETNRGIESDLEKDKVDEEKSTEKISEDEKEESSFKERSEVDSDMEMNLEKDMINKEKPRDKPIHDRDEESLAEERSEGELDMEMEIYDEINFDNLSDEEAEVDYQLFLSKTWGEHLSSDSKELFYMKREFLHLKDLNRRDILKLKKKIIRKRRKNVRFMQRVEMGKPAVRIYKRKSDDILKREKSVFTNELMNLLNVKDILGIGKASDLKEFHEIEPKGKFLVDSVNSEVIKKECLLLLDKKLRADKDHTRSNNFLCIRNSFLKDPSIPIEHSVENIWFNFETDSYRLDFHYPPGRCSRKIILFTKPESGNTDFGFSEVLCRQILPSYAPKKIKMSQLYSYLVTLLRKEPLLVRENERFHEEMKAVLNSRLAEENLASKIRKKSPDVATKTEVKISKPKMADEGRKIGQDIISFTMETLKLSAPLSENEGKAVYRAIFDELCDEALKKLSLLQEQFDDATVQFESFLDGCRGWDEELNEEQESIFMDTCVRFSSVISSIKYRSDAQRNITKATFISLKKKLFHDPRLQTYISKQDA